MPESAAVAHDHGFVASRTVDTPGLHSRVLDELGQAICEGRLAAGTIVTTEALASRYQVSRSVIRESLRTLAAMGMVASKQRVGNRILPLSEWNVYDPGVIRWRLAGRARLEQLRSITELRTAIEPEAARLAARRGTLAQAGELVGLAGRLWAAGKGAEHDEFLAIDIEFHTLIMRMSGNEMFARLNDLVAGVLAGRTQHGLMPAHPDSEALQLHMDVAGAIQRRDADAAAAAMLGIVHQTMAEMTELWEAGDDAAPGTRSPAPHPRQGLALTHSPVST